MVNKKSKLVKTFIRIAFAAICITVISPFIMYFGVENTDIQNTCNDGFKWDEETQSCQINEKILQKVDDEEIQTAESCKAQNGTWYEANQVCILPTE